MSHGARLIALTPVLIMPRVSWKGFLNLSLVSVPVKAYSANNSSGSIRLNQLHAECGSRIKYQNHCPVCDVDISRSDIVKGYEYAKDQYVVIDLDELEKLRAQDEGKAIRIESFVPPEKIDPIYLSETSYFLVPDGAPGQKPFALLKEALTKKGLVCIARVVLHNKDHLVQVRALDATLVMTTLRYASQVKSADQFSEECEQPKISKEEFSMAETLIKEIVKDDFDINDYSDTYHERLTQLIEAKVEGKEIVAAPAVESAPVVNLMDALKASVARVRGETVATTSKKRVKSTPVKKKVAKKKAKPKKKATKKTTKKSKRKTKSA